MNKITIGNYEYDPKWVDMIERTLKDGFLSTGPIVDIFEEDVAKLCDKKYGVFVNSGQSALEVALIGAKVKLGINNPRVVVPATTYAATLWAIINSGCTPVFCDINENYVLDYDSIIKNPNYFAADIILSVDLCGYAAVPPKEILDHYFIVEDACEAFGNKYCTYGDIICHSFYVSHILTTGHGGMVSTNDKEIAEYIRSYIAHGRVFGGDFTAYKDAWVDRFAFDKVGVSCRLGCLEAAIGVVEIEKVSDIIQKRKDNAMALITKYDTDSTGVLESHFIFPSLEYHNKCVYQFFPILIKDQSIQRAQLLQYLFKKGIDSRVLLSLTNQSIVRKLYGKIDIGSNFHDYVNDYGFIVGCHQGLKRNDMWHITNSLIDYIEVK